MRQCARAASGFIFVGAWPHCSAAEPPCCQILFLQERLSRAGFTDQLWPVAEGEDVRLQLIEILPKCFRLAGVRKRFHA